VRVVIVGCGRTGAMLAEILDAAGHAVLVVDIRTSAFARLPESFGGEAVRGDGIDEAVLRRAGAADADLFMFLTEGDNRNIMGAQVARNALQSPRVFAKVNDPVRAEAYAELGIATVCRTAMIADTLLATIGQPPTGIPSLFERPRPAAAGDAREAAPAGPRPGEAREG
jgi:trk system potassium uptake protein TrkA